jgi:hypothetical protein
VKWTPNHTSHGFWAWETAQPDTPGFLALEQENARRMQLGVYWPEVEKQKENAGENDFPQAI